MLYQTLPYSLRLFACLFVLLSLNTHSASVTTQVQKMSYESIYSEHSCDLDPELCEPITIDYSNDDLFFTFTATWDDATRTLNGSVSDGSSFQFTDGYYEDEYEDYSGSSESESVAIGLLNGEITSFQAYNYYNDDIGATSSTISWVYDGDELVRTYFSDDPVAMSYGSNSLTYDVISPSPVPLPAGIYLFLSGLVGLGLMRRKVPDLCSKTS